MKEKSIYIYVLPKLNYKALWHEDKTTIHNEIARVSSPNKENSGPN